MGPRHWHPQAKLWPELHDFPAGAPLRGGAHSNGGMSLDANPVVAADKTKYGANHVGTHTDPMNTIIIVTIQLQFYNNNIIIRNT
jgi:hypothetical protein